MASFYLSQASISSATHSDEDQGSISAPFETLAIGSSFAYQFLLNSHQDQDYHLQNMLHHHQQETKDQQLINGSNDWKPSLASENYTHDHGDHEGSSLELSLCTKAESVDHDRRPNVKWMSSKMRIMRKMMKSGHKLATRHTRRSIQEHTSMVPNQESSANSTTEAVIRVCSDCNTTKTPLWRSGPQGPKSLCNACGIRQRKARRAMAAAAAAENGGGQILQTKPASPAKLPQDRQMFGEQALALPIKKRGWINTNSITSNHANKKKLCFGECKMSLSNKSAFHQVFPQDESVDAAFLLMDLSCGLIKS